MNTHEVIEKLKNLPQEIYDLQIEILEKTIESNDFSKKISKAESVIRINISEMKDDSGKKKYSNEESRKAAFSEIAELDEDLISWKKEQELLDSQILRKKANFELLVNEQKNLRAILIFLSNSKTENI